MFIHIIAYIFIGIFSGILSGLLGLGGGIVVVPALMAMNFSIHTAVGTSLAIITFTTASAVWAQQKRGAVSWRHLRILIPAMVLGAIFGVWLGQYLASSYIKIIFAVFSVLLSLKMFFDNQSAQENQWKYLTRRSVMFSVALIAGGLAGLLGIGGGVLVIPILIALSLPMPVVSGTSAACAFPTALTGTIFTILANSHIHPGAPFSNGLIYWPAALIIGLVSLFSAPIGVSLSHRLPEKIVKRIFGVVLLIIAWQMATE